MICSKPATGGLGSTALRRAGRARPTRSYRTRKRAFGLLKRYFWTLENAAKREICAELESAACRCSSR
jgi:hypothetical protein